MLIFVICGLFSIAYLIGVFATVCHIVITLLDRDDLYGKEMPYTSALRKALIGILIAFAWPFLLIPYFGNRYESFISNLKGDTK